MKVINRFAWVTAMCLVAACGGSDTGGGSSSGETSKQSNCQENHLCVNGSCTCTDGPNKDKPCCDPNDSSCTENKCDTYCEYCN